MNNDTLPPSLTNIPTPQIKLISEDEYWKQHIDIGVVVKPLKKPCGDCAITNGFYLEYAKLLEKKPNEIQIAVSDRWFCHNNCNRACKGLKDYLETKK